MPTTYVAMSPHYWGKGDTVEEAKKQLKAAGGTLQRCVVVRCPDKATDVYVDGMGSICWTWSDDATDEERRNKTCETVAKRGV